MTGSPVITPGVPAGAGNGALRLGVPPQAYVMATQVFLFGVLLAVTTVVNNSRRRKA